MDNLSTLIEKAIGLKSGNREFVLYHLDPEWRAAIGNRSGDVLLMEASPEFETDADTPEAAVAGLIDLLVAAHGQQAPQK